MEKLNLVVYLPSEPRVLLAGGTTKSMFFTFHARPTLQHVVIILIIQILVEIFVQYFS